MLRLRSLPVVMAQPDKNINKNIALCWIGKIDAEKNTVIQKKTPIVHNLSCKTSEFRI